MPSRVDPFYAVDVEVAPVYKELVKEYYSFAGDPSNSIVRKYSNKYQEWSVSSHRISNDINYQTCLSTVHSNIFHVKYV